MKNTSKFSLVAFMLMSVLNMSAAVTFAGEIKKGDLKSATEIASTMNIEVIDINGSVDFKDVVTVEDPALNFDLKSMPAGRYTIQVNSGNEIINATEVNTLTTDKSVITVEVLNWEGDKVFGSNVAGDNFNLENMPKGEYVINIYKGQELINTNKIVQLKELIVK